MWYPWIVRYHRNIIRCCSCSEKGARKETLLGKHIELYKLKTQLSNDKSEHNIANGPSIPNGTDAHLANGSTVVDDKPRFVSTISLSDSVVSMESLEAGNSRNSLNLSQSNVQLTPGKGIKAAENRPPKPESRN